MNGLILDTASEKSILLLVKDYQPCAHLYLHGGPTLSDELLPAIESFLAENHLSIEEIHLIGSGIGPGSYTGLRIGATVAKTLSYARNIPLVGFCSLMGFSPPHEGTFVTVFDARSAGFYVIKGKKENGQIHFLSLPYLASFDVAIELFDKTEMILSPDRDLLSIRLEEDLGKFAPKMFDLCPDPLQIATLTKERYLAGEYSSKGELSLIYLRND